MPPKSQVKMIYRAYIAEFADGLPDSTTWAIQLLSRPFPLPLPLPNGLHIPSKSALFRVEIASHDPETWAWAQPLDAEPERDARFLRKQWIGDVEADYFPQVADVARRASMIPEGVWNSHTWCIDALDALGRAGLLVWREGERRRAIDRVMLGLEWAN